MVRLTNEIINLAGRGSEYSKIFIVDQNQYLSDAYKHCGNVDKCILRAYQLHIGNLERIKSELVQAIEADRLSRSQVVVGSENAPEIIPEIEPDKSIDADLSLNSAESSERLDAGRGVEIGAADSSTSFEVTTQDSNGSSTNGLATQRLIKISFLAALSSFALLLFAAFTNRVVIFYDWVDFGKTLLIFVSLVVSALLILYFDGDWLMQALFGGAAILVAVYYMVYTFKSSISHNSSVVIGLFVGFFKILFSLIMAILVLGKFSDFKNNNKSGGDKLAALIFLAFFGFLTYLFVNGDRVEQRRKLNL